MGVGERLEVRGAVWTWKKGGRTIYTRRGVREAKTNKHQKTQSPTGKINWIKLQQMCVLL